MTVLYLHGKGGSAAESAHYASLFPGCRVEGLDYKTFTPWETGAEIRAAVEALRRAGERVILVANSIGACFALYAGIDDLIERAYFISPVVDMEGLIRGMMRSLGVTEDELRAKGVIETPFGDPLSWEYLSFVRQTPVAWHAPTDILYGARDALTSCETIAAFAAKTGARLCVMQDGEHWFHTAEQLRFLDQWIKQSQGKKAIS